MKTEPPDSPTPGTEKTIPKHEIRYRFAIDIWSADGEIVHFVADGNYPLALHPDHIYSTSSNLQTLMEMKVTRCASVEFNRVTNRIINATIEKETEDERAVFERLQNKYYQKITPELTRSEYQTVHPLTPEVQLPKYRPPAPKREDFSDPPPWGPDSPEEQPPVKVRPAKVPATEPLAKVA